MNGKWNNMFTNSSAGIRRIYKSSVITTIPKAQ